MLNSKIAKSVRLALAFGAASTAGISANAIAAEEGADDVERIEVTGSRIKRTDLETATPVQVTSAEDIAMSGFTRVEDIMNNLPQIEASQTAFQSNGATGTATLDLRGMGAQRTLVLINGRRAQAGGIYTQSADINQIPAALIKRVEVMTGGGSTTYGADAVAGVVNFVMNDDFEGFQVDIGGSAYQHDNDNEYIQGLMDERDFEYPSGSDGFDGAAFDFSATLGGTFDGGKGHAVGYVTYTKQNELRQGARDYSSCALNAAGTACGGSGNAVIPNFYVSLPTETGGVDFGEDMYEYWTLTPDSGFTDSVGNVYNYAPINHFMRPDERHTFGLFANYEINEHFNPYVETMFMRDRTTAQIAESGTFFDTSYVMDFDSPLISDAQREALAERFGIGSGDQFATYIGKRNVEGGPRSDKLEHNSFRMVLGTRGELSDLWTYDVTAQYGSTSSSSAYINDFFGPRITTALSANGESCADSDGCIPYEVFTYEGVTSEAAGALTGTAILNGVTEQIILGGFVSGEFDYTLPSSDYPIAAVFGAEYREENFERTADEVYAQGLLLGQGGTTKSLEGSYDVTEFYTEVSLPIVEGKTGFENFTLDLAYRWSDYSTSGSEPTYKAAINWDVTSDWKIRASYNRAVRAANNGELFAQQSSGLWPGVDPCAGANPELTAAQCANTGVSASQYGSVGKSPADQYNGFFGGNPDLKPEIADTITLGLVAEPIEGLNFSLDYWDIELEDAIGNIDPEIIVRQCGITGDPVLCDDVQRTAGSGSLWIGDGQVVATDINLGQLHWEGIDLSANYDFEVAGGTLSTNLIGSYFMTKEFDNLPGITESYDCVGTLNNGCFAQPEWRHVFTMNYDTGSFWRATLKWRYYGEVSDYTGDDTLVQDGISSQSYLDLKGSFTINDYTNVLVGVNNIMDKEPPLVGGSLSTNGNAIAGFYDTLGRYFHANVTFKF
ncbi:TonB-dependent receptor domain-containing protein [Pseudoalteromonas ruthenica]|uniref:TonB-dependent receptor n=1 Tax=Pseudoalteromonas ruthenica TaxID=151081 RepID=A0A0F4PQ29_9GAMM|nr:TonB-dependent receptor [Pseudoalteromonas ruthenica]KJY96267.1 TonB-dependent receptor [Pseudoalteromonas ruthenica]KJY96366.1 TonB-dependent receptor [Pseudoalteromonas ruthenica]TMO89914.1 TonB-dependent receptor [Pseudoalteromonas ruthenica]TMO92839.1 TonB-dependent receptor [Pseudoalteromonas ruthenica]TMO96253.1 TonB-dependent receptor [Pseudoalteromonas ruthenica]